MRWRNKFGWVALCVILLIPLLGYSIEVGDARTAGCLPPASLPSPATVCSSCHEDSQKRWAARQNQPCTAYCMSCHKKAEMERHHTIGSVLPDIPGEVLRLTEDKKTACFTCHNLSQPRYDSVRWKAASLFDRLFRSESRYKTFFLAQRNEQGQLCQNCH
jgi:hypothetical protein